MRLIWASNYNSRSGYSHQARLFVPRLIQHGHDVFVLNIGGGVGMPQQVGNVTLLSVFNDPLGRDALRYYYASRKAHAVITLIDAWAYAGAGLDKLNWYPITPVDHMPLPPGVGKALVDCKLPLAMSRWGETVLQQAGFNPIYLPLTVDLSIWQPGDKAAARNVLGWPQDVFIAAFVGVNDSVPSRKGIFELLGAWQMFNREHPDGLLYLHTSMLGNLADNNRHGGINIPEVIKTLGINPESIIWVDQGQYKSGLPTPHLVAVAQAADVLVAPSRGEGFGLPALEFQACGCPVITTDFSTQSELNFGGWLVDYEPELSWQGSVWAKPTILGIYESLGSACEENNNEKRHKLAIEGAQEYNIDTVMSRYMLPALHEIGERVLEF